MVQLLSDHNKDVQAAGANGWTALHFAAQHGHEVIVRRLSYFLAGADVNASDNDE